MKQKVFHLNALIYLNRDVLMFQYIWKKVGFKNDALYAVW